MPTHILRNDRPKGGLTQAGKRHDLKAVRWYVLTLPTAAGGRRDRISPSKGLDVELSRRERRGEALFEYFAPSYVEVRKVGGKLVNTRRPLLFNYVFIRSSVEEIFRMKQALPLYNFLPRVSSGSTTYFPHLLDQEMANLALGGGGLLQRAPGVRAGEYPLVEGGSGTHHVRLFYRDGGRGGDPAGRRS